MEGIEKLASHGALMRDWESEVIKQQLFAQIKDAAYAARVGRQLFDYVKLTAGSALDFDLEDKDSITFTKLGEGVTIPYDAEAYTKVTVTPAKYGATVMMSSEMKEDANWDLLRRNVRRMGTMAGLKEDALIVAAMADATYGFAATTNHAFNSSGTELDIVDIVTAVKRVKENDYYPNVMLIHPTQEAELNQIDTFVEADKVGSRATFERGFCGRIFGLDVITSSSCTEDKVYVLDSREAGVYVERRPLTMKAFEVPEKDSVAVAVTFRGAARVLRSAAGCEITVQ